MKKHLHWFIISTFVSLYLVVSIISTIHVIDFFKLSNPDWLAIFLAISFEIGAAASLASLLVLKKMNKTLVWILFFVLTAMQGMGNTFYAFINLENFESWSQLFGLDEEEIIFQKRVLSLISGAILPLVALGFIKSLVDYIKPDDGEITKAETRNPDLENETPETVNDSSIDKNQEEIIIDGGGILVRDIDNLELERPDRKISVFEVVNTEQNDEKSEPPILENENGIDQREPEENIGNSEIENVNANRTKISDRPSPQVDPTLL